MSVEVFFEIGLFGCPGNLDRGAMHFYMYRIFGMTGYFPVDLHAIISVVYKNKRIVQ